jgi:hypothetical protein
VNEMDKKDKFRERTPIAQWPELDRRMAIIARMTSDPPPIQQQDNVPQMLEELDTLSLYSENQTERKLPIG